MGHRVLAAADAIWQPSRVMGVANCDISTQLELGAHSARLWRMRPGQCNTRHRHKQELEVYMLLEGSGRIRIDGELLTLAPLSAVAVEPQSLRQVFNDTGQDQLWLIIGGPRETFSEEEFGWVYPDGREARPPELGG